MGKKLGCCEFEHSHVSMLPSPSLSKHQGVPQFHQQQKQIHLIARENKPAVVERPQLEERVQPEPWVHPQQEDTFEFV